MIRLTIRQILLLKVFKDYDGFNGKINIQKIIFALQTAKLINFHYSFSTGIYGPFSETLEQDINYLCDIGFLIEEHHGRVRVKDIITNKSFFNNYNEFFNRSKNNKILEYRIVEMLEQDLQSTHRIELAISFIYLIIHKKIHKKEDLFSAIERWKPGDFIDEDKISVWDAIVDNGIINEKGEVKIPVEDNDIANDNLDSYVFVEDPDLRASYQNDLIKFDEMLEIIYNNGFWENLVKIILDRTECKFWDFKQTLEMWEVSKTLKQLKQIEFCEKVAAFANRKGGIILIGVTDKIPRKILGVTNLESKLQSINIILKKLIDYQDEFFTVEEIILKDSNGMKKSCIAIIIAQTKDPVGVKNLNHYYSYPVRLETGFDREDFPKIKKKKKPIDFDNFNFINLLNIRI